MSGGNPAAPSPTEQTILVVEADVLVRMVIAEYLRQCGYRVLEAVHADEAMTVLQQDHIEVDVVFADVAAKASTSGFGLSQWVRAHRKDIDMIMVASPDRAAQEAGDLCEQGPLLRRPYDPQHVVERIRRLMAERVARQS